MSRFTGKRFIGVLVTTVVVCSSLIGLAFAAGPSDGGKPAKGAWSTIKGWFGSGNKDQTPQSPPAHVSGSSGSAQGGPYRAPGGTPPAPSQGAFQVPPVPGSVVPAQSSPSPTVSAPPKLTDLPPAEQALVEQQVVVIRRLEAVQKELASPDMKAIETLVVENENNYNYALGAGEKGVKFLDLSTRQAQLLEQQARLQKQIGTDLVPKYGEKTVNNLINKARYDAEIKGPLVDPEPVKPAQNGAPSPVKANKAPVATPPSDDAVVQFDPKQTEEIMAEVDRRIRQQAATKTPPSAVRPDSSSETSVPSGKTETEANTLFEAMEKVRKEGGAKAPGAYDKQDKVPTPENPHQGQAQAKAVKGSPGGRGSKPSGGGSPSGSIVPEGVEGPGVPGGLPRSPSGSSRVGGFAQGVEGVAGRVAGPLGALGFVLDVYHLPERVAENTQRAALDNTYGSGFAGRVAEEGIDLGELEDPEVAGKLDKLAKEWEGEHGAGNSDGDVVLEELVGFAVPVLNLFDDVSDALDEGVDVARDRGGLVEPPAPVVPDSGGLVADADSSAKDAVKGNEEGSGGEVGEVVSVDKKSEGQGEGGSDTAADVAGDQGAPSIKGGGGGQGGASGVKSGGKGGSGGVGEGSGSFENPGDSDGVGGDDMSVAPGSGDNQNTELDGGSGGMSSEEDQSSDQGGCVGAGCDMGMVNPFDESGGGGCGSGGDGCRGFRDMRSHVVFDADLGLTGLVGKLVSLVSNGRGVGVLDLVANWDTGGGGEGPKFDPKSGGGLLGALGSVFAKAFGSKDLRDGASGSRQGVLGLVDLVADWGVDGNDHGPLGSGGGDGPSKSGLVSNKADGDGYDGRTPGSPKGASTLAAGHRTGATRTTIAGTRTVKTNRSATTVQQQTAVQTPTATAPQTQKITAPQAPTTVTAAPITQTQSPATKISSPTNTTNQIQNPTSQLSNSE